MRVENFALSLQKILAYFILNQSRLTCTYVYIVPGIKKYFKIQQDHYCICLNCRNTGKEGEVVVGTVPAGH